MSATLIELEERLERVERSNRYLRNFGLSSVAVLVALISLGAGEKPTAPSLVTDARGRVVHEAIVAKALHLVDREGALRILISARAGLSLLDDQRRPRAVLSVDATGPGLLLYGETSRAGTALTVNDDGPALSLRDDDGRTRALLAAVDQGPALILSDEGARERVVLIQRGGTASLSVLDGNGQTTWRAP